MLIDAAEQASRYEQFCRQLAGKDLADTPLYIVLQSMLPEITGGNGCYGYTAWHLDLYLREFIPNYRGRGPCFVINDLAYQADYADEDQNYVLTGCVMHELAHVLDRPMLVAARPNVAPQTIVMEAAETAEITNGPMDYEIPRYYGHGESFIRIVLHLCHRAERLGVSISPARICAGPRYGLSHADEYLEALGDEPARMIDLPIRHIHTTNPPNEFTSLWLGDLDRFHAPRSFSRSSL